MFHPKSSVEGKAGARGLRGQFLGPGKQCLMVKSPAQTSWTSALDSRKWVCDSLDISPIETTGIFFPFVLKEGLGGENGGLGHMDSVGEDLADTVVSGKALELHERRKRMDQPYSLEGHSPAQAPVKTPGSSSCEAHSL